MFRKSALAMAMLGAMATGNVVALGLGEIELKSALNQPLKAQVELLSATDAELQELKVELGSSQAFASAGIERPLFLTKLRFQVTKDTDGNGIIKISSRDAVKEPFLDFLLEISWSKGRLLREYTVLVDPPVTMPAAAPVTQAPYAQSAPQAQSAPVQPSYRVTHTAEYPPVATHATAPGEYLTRRNDTLWKVAQQVRPDAGVSIEQTMQGLLRANPEAFVDNNINNLKAGYILRVPDRDELTSMSKAEAARESRAQYAAWREARAMQAPAMVQQEAAGEMPAPGAETSAGSSLQLIAPEMAEGDASAVGDGAADPLQHLQQELLLANEALEEQRRQGEDMSQRLSTLEEQIVNMQRLIQLKDDELARLQAQAGDSAGEQPAETVEAMPMEDAVGETAVAEETMGESTVAEETLGESVVDGEMVGETGLGEEAGGEAAVAEETGEMPAETDPFELAETDPAMGDELTAAETMGAEMPVDDAMDVQPPAGEFGTEEVPVEPMVAESEPEPAMEQPRIADTGASPGFVDRLMSNPMWLGAGAVVLVLLAFFGLRRKRGVETEFQESILQAAKEDSSISSSDSEIVASEPTSKDSTSTESSLLSEFAVSDMGSIKNDSEADPLAEADVYLAYGRYQQAEDLIKDALENDPEREDLNLKLLEVFMAGKNQVAFDEQAQGILARLEDTDDPMWKKVAEMGREISPHNPMYQTGGEAPAAADEDADRDALSSDVDFNMDDNLETPEVPESEGESKAADEGLDFDIDLSFDASEEMKEEQPDSAEFTPPEDIDEIADIDETALNVDMDRVEPDSVDKDNEIDFDIEGLDLGSEEEAEVVASQGDGELADLDEVSTKLDLARAYIDMGDPDGAKSILDEVMEEGSDNQKDEARGIMAQMG